jgi:hypothetical protein
MERIFYLPTKFTTKGETFDTPSGLGGTFTVVFSKKTKDGCYEFVRPKKHGWPRATYSFTEAQLRTEIFHTIPDKYDRLMISEEKRLAYEAMLADPCVERRERI